MRGRAEPQQPGAAVSEPLFVRLVGPSAFSGEQDEQLWAGGGPDHIGSVALPVVHVWGRNIGSINSR